MTISPRFTVNPWIQAAAALFVFTTTLAALTLIATQCPWAAIPISQALRATQIYLDLRGTSRRRRGRTGP